MGARCSSSAYAPLLRHSRLQCETGIILYVLTLLTVSIYIDGSQSVCELLPLKSFFLPLKKINMWHQIKCFIVKINLGAVGLVPGLNLFINVNVALSPIVHKQQIYRGAFVFPGSHLYIFTSWILTDRSSCSSSSSSSSFRFMAVHSLGVLPPPIVYLAHMIVVLGAQLFFLSWVARMLPCEYLT